MAQLKDQWSGDRLLERLKVSEDQLEPPPETLAGESRGLILAVCKLPTQLILVLDAVRAADPGEPPGHRSAP